MGKKIGRPKGITPQLGIISFRADEETRAAIDKLTAALALPGVVGGVARGVAIRRALIDAARRIKINKEGVRP